MSVLYSGMQMLSKYVQHGGNNDSYITTHNCPQTKFRIPVVSENVKHPCFYRLNMQFTQ